MVIHACNPSTLEAEAGEWQVQDQPGLFNETLSQINKKKRVEVNREGHVK
jgi:hypothetical protein